MLLAEAMIFLVITIPLLFSQHWITVFWAIQATVPHLGRRETRQ